jgi:hypothetical protein
MSTKKTEFLDKFDDLIVSYGSGTLTLKDLGDYGSYCLTKLKDIPFVPQGTAMLNGIVKNYSSYQMLRARCRPIRTDIYINDPGVFLNTWKGFIDGMDPSRKKVDFDRIDHAVYTLTQSFSALIDLFKPGSRKTPGTFLEIIIGMILTEVSGLKMEKQIPVPGESYKIPTDIVLIQPVGSVKPNLVVPIKITTRERIVQPFVHQRILDAVYGEKKYESILVMVSELQRDDEGAHGLNEICVPNQISLYQKYLGRLSGMYYLDVPNAYATSDFSRLIPVRTVGDLLRQDLAVLIG